LFLVLFFFLLSTPFQASNDFAYCPIIDRCCGGRTDAEVIGYVFECAIAKNFFQKYAKFLCPHAPQGPIQSWVLKLIDDRETGRHVLFPHLRPYAGLFHKLDFVLQYAGFATQMPSFAVSYRRRKVSREFVAAHNAKTF
jgi:hypothetical protein